MKDVYIDKNCMVLILQIHDLIVFTVNSTYLIRHFSQFILLRMYMNNFAKPNKTKGHI